MEQLQTLRFRSIRIALDATAAAGREFSFLDQDDLKECIVEGIEVFSASDIPITHEGGAVVSDVDAIKLSLCMSEGSTDKERYIPYWPQRVTINAGVVRRYRGLRPSWPQCRIRVVQALAGVTVQYAYVGIHFRYLTDPR